MLKRVIPHRVRVARVDAGLTQAELAKRADLSLSTVVAVEGGQMSDLRLSTLVALSWALDVTLHYLTGVEDGSDAPLICPLCGSLSPHSRRHGIATCIRTSHERGASVDALLERYHDVPLAALEAILPLLASTDAPLR
jgi:DNA-binding XRE family transcriptional regulator